MYNSVILILCHENAHSITTLDIDRMVRWVLGDKVSRLMWVGLGIALVWLLLGILLCFGVW